MDLDETVFSSHKAIEVLTANSLISSTQRLFLDTTQYQTHVNILVDKNKLTYEGDKVCFFYCKKHMELFSKASQATGSGFCLFFITNGLYSEKSVNEIIKSACLINNITPPTENFRVYNRIDLFGRYEHEPDHKKVSDKKNLLMVRHRVKLRHKYSNQSEKNTFYFIDDNLSNREIIHIRQKAEVIDPTDRYYSKEIDKLISLADQEIAKTAAALARAFEDPDVV
ncbi:hypothetical protein [Pelagibaculum spongiae]|uniref:Uncharacterized protein n=1 Tax=Pelagibaculum spongiae TaxID=2080658 RepID=A0A2V1GYM8_9GAMM|nr:hypothetical protein [Pelagibaculum spongiae]PVZ68156.1 hypothetical protein DC094_12700 [Pelagibaculum spongiae]